MCDMHTVLGRCQSYLNEMHSVAALPFLNNHSKRLLFPVGSCASWSTTPIIIIIIFTLQDTPPPERIVYTIAIQNCARLCLRIWPRKVKKNSAAPRNFTTFHTITKLSMSGPVALTAMYLTHFHVFALSRQWLGPPQTTGHIRAPREFEPKLTLTTWRARQSMTCKLHIFARYHYAPVDTGWPVRQTEYVIRNPRLHSDLTCLGSG